MPTPADREQAARPPWRVGSFGEALRELREARGLSLRQAAPKLSTSAPQLSRLERGLIPADLAVAHAAEALFSEELQDRHAAGRLTALAMAAQAGPPGASGDARSSTELVPPPLVLVGRDQELGQLRAALDAGGLTVMHGMTGVGKTALLSSAVHRLAQGSHDGILTAQTCDSLDPDVAFRVLGKWLADLGIVHPDQPVTTDGRASLIARIALGRPRLVLIVEDVARPEHLQPLLRLAGSVKALIVTSHNQLPDLTLRAGARPMLVRPLPGPPGAELLRSVLPESSPAAPDDVLEAVARLCGGLPLVLEHVADLMGRHKQLTMMDLHDLLADDTQRLTVLSDVEDSRYNIRAALIRTYETMPEDVRWLFRLLGLHGGPVVTLAAAAALAGQRRDVVNRGLLALADAHMLDAAGDGRWRWADLPRLVAGELVHDVENPFQIVHAARRTARWLVRLAAAAAGDRDGAETSRTPRHELQDEAVNLTALTSMAVRHGQAGLVQQLISWLDTAELGELALRCSAAPSPPRRARTTWSAWSTSTPQDGRSP